MDSDNHYQQGSEPSSVLVADVRDAARYGWTLVTDPQTVLIDGSRLVYETAGNPPRTSLVAVLAPGTKYGRNVLREITAQRRRARSLVRKADIVNRKELMARAGCGEQTLKRWRAITTFPKPFAELGGMDLWDYKEVRRWIVERDRWLSPRSQRLRKRS